MLKKIIRTTEFQTKIENMMFKFKSSSNFNMMHRRLGMKRRKEENRNLEYLMLLKLHFLIKIQPLLSYEQMII